MKIVVGIDEVGRGPLAGPVSVGFFFAEKKMEKWLLKNIFDNNLKDSKKLRGKQRVAINRYILKLKKEGKVDFKIVHSSNKLIDKIGISNVIRKSINEILSENTLLKSSPQSSRIFSCWKIPRARSVESRKELWKDFLRDTSIRLDGSLKAPKEFTDQETIIKGDEKNVFIACASIVAKVERDRLMVKIAKKYSKYGLEIHKGYGTKAHREAIKKYGLSDIHRTTFCTKISPTTFSRTKSSSGLPKRGK